MWSCNCSVTNGRTDWYGEGLGAKALPDGCTKFRSDRVALGLPVPTPPSIKRATVTASEGWTFYPFEGGCCSQSGYQSTTSPIDMSTVVNPAPEAVYQRLQTTYTTMTISGLSPTTVYQVRFHLSSINFTGWQNVNQMVWVSNGGSPNSVSNVTPYGGAFNKAMVVTVTMQPNASGQFMVGISPTAPGNTTVVSGVEIVPAP